MANKFCPCSQACIANLVPMHNQISPLSLYKLQVIQRPKKKLSHIPCDLTIFSYKIWDTPPMQSKLHHLKIFQKQPKTQNIHNFSQTEPEKNTQKIPQSHKSQALKTCILHRETPKFPAKHHQNTHTLI